MPSIFNNISRSTPLELSSFKSNAKFTQGGLKEGLPYSVFQSKTKQIYFNFEKEKKKK